MQVTATKQEALPQMATKLHTDISMIEINGKTGSSPKQTNSEQPRIIRPNDIAATVTTSETENGKSGKLVNIEEKGTSLRDGSTDDPEQEDEENDLEPELNGKVNEDRKPHLSNLVTKQRPSVSSRSSSHSGGSLSSQKHQSKSDQEIKTVPPRKRSKVSRACDQCRRKKIRCNAVLNMTSNQLLKTCSNCQKNGDMCTFTRIPLKRGPNKGYTKSCKRKSASTGSHSPMSQKSSGFSYSTFSAPEIALDARNSLLGNVPSILSQQIPSQQPQGPLSLEGFKSAQQILLPPMSYPSFSEAGFSAVTTQPQLLSQSQPQRQQFQFQSPSSQPGSQLRVQGHSRSQSLSQYGVTQPQQLSQMQAQASTQTQSQVPNQVQLQPQIQQQQPTQQSQVQQQQQQQQQQNNIQQVQPQMMVPPGYRTPYTYNYRVPVLPPPNTFSGPGPLVYSGLPSRVCPENSPNISIAGVSLPKLAHTPGSEQNPNLDESALKGQPHPTSQRSVTSLNTTQPMVSTQRPVSSFSISRVSSSSQTPLRTSPVQNTLQSLQPSPCVCPQYAPSGYYNELVQPSSAPYPAVQTMSYSSATVPYRLNDQILDTAAPEAYYAYSGQQLPVQSNYAPAIYNSSGQVYTSGVMLAGTQRVVNPPSGSPASMSGQNCMLERAKGSSRRRSNVSKKNRSCAICHKVFNRPSGLRIHMHTHTGEKPFVCEWKNCGKRFSVRSNMLRHMLIHKREERRKKAKSKMSQLKESASQDAALDSVSQKRGGGIFVKSHAEQEKLTQPKENGFPDGKASL